MGGEHGGGDLLLARLAFQRGMDAMQAGDIDEAVTQFEAVVANDPGAPVGFLRLGDAYSAQGRREDAVTQWRIAAAAGSGEAHKRLQDAGG